MTRDPEWLSSRRVPENRKPDATIESVPSMGSQPAEPRQAEAQPPAARPARYPQTMRELLQRVDDAWVRFRAAAAAFPSERMDERLSEGGWTRKQMLAHIAAWHDLTHDRIGKLITTGKSTPLTETDDAINARVARQATGRSAGEILKEMEMTFNRLRRQLGRLTDDQLEADDGWAAQVIAGNTYEHYDEHRADVHMAELSQGRGARR